MTAYLLLLFIFILLIYLYSKYFRDNRPDKSIPTPAIELPLVGHYFYFIGKDIYTLYDDTIKYKTFWHNIPAIGWTLFISDPPSIKAILEDTDTFSIPPLRKVLSGEIFGDGIFLSNGDSWSHQRAIAKPIFSVPSRTDMFQVYHRCGENLLSLLETHLLTQQPVELQQLFKRFTLDTFSEIGYGLSINSLLTPLPFSDTFDWLLLEVDNRIMAPWRTFTHGWLWRKKLNDLECFIQSVIGQRRREGWEGKADFLSRLLEMEANHEVTGVTPKFLRDQIVNFFVAGRDTTALLLSFTYYYLSTHPEVEKKVYQEIKRVVGEEKVSMEHTKSLKYLHNVLSESLRLIPPAVPHNIRIPNREVVLPNGARVPKGIKILYSPFCVHRLKEYWGEDALLFNPDRWDNEGVLKHPYQYVPFQKGPRICLGMNMAYEEAKCCMVMIYQRGYRFCFEGNRDKRLLLRDAALLFAKDGIKMRVERV